MDTYKETRTAYAKTAATRAAARSDLGTWQIEVEELMSYLAPDTSVLDIGCGSSGSTAILCNALEVSYVGITYTTEEIQEARLRVQGQLRNPASTQFLVMDMRALAFQQALFGGFCAIASLLHIRKQDIKRTLCAIRYTVQKKGFGFIAVEELPHGSQQEENAVYDEHGNGRWYTYYTIEEFATILKHCGFTVLRQCRAEKSYAPGRVWLEYFVRT